MQKYTEYSNTTGITKTSGQHTLGVIPRKGLSATGEQASEAEAAKDFAGRLEDISETVRMFGEERGWSAGYTPRNVALCLVGEMGELAELFMFRGDAVNERWTATEHDRLGQEIADVTIYLIHLARVCEMELHIELPYLYE